MKCQKCGARLPEGRLYCEQCGEEVQMVPDFEPELENSLTDVLSGLAREVIEDKLNIPLRDRSESVKVPSPKKEGKNWDRYAWH